MAYWTDRGTKGEVDFSPRRSDVAESYEEAQALFADRSEPSETS